MLPVKWVLLDSVHRCNNLRSFKQVQTQLITSGIVYEDAVVNRVVEFFGRSFDSFEYACDFLKQITCDKSSFPFNTLIYRYADGSRPQSAFLFYRRIARDGFLADMYTFPAVLKSCAKFLGIGEGRQVHTLAVKLGLLRDLYVQNSLVHLYGVCGLCDSIKVFDDMPVRDVVSWTGIISGCVKSGSWEKAVTLFSRMNVEPNMATYVSVLVACGRRGYLSMGRGIHGLILKRSWGISLEASNCVMDMYVKCECLCEAKKIFDEISEKDIVSWTIMISGLLQCKRPMESLELFSHMQTSGVKPDGIILTSVLAACANLGALDCGRWVHEYIDRRGIKWDVHIGTAMIDMYAKCGCIDMALHIFNGMPRKNVFTWNAFLAGLAMHGHGHKVLNRFEEMVKVGMRPNEVTFLAILTACCHSGLVDEGRKYFYQMTSQPYNYSPSLEHYGCLVDLLCRAGLLEQALLLVKGMPMSPDVMIWGALLSSCKANRNVELSQEILHRLLELESHDSGVYVLLSNIYASNKRWADATRVRRLMKERGIKKAPGSSLIEMDGKAHEFIVGDTSHPRNEDILRLLRVLAYQINLEGHSARPFLT